MKWQTKRNSTIFNLLSFPSSLVAPSHNCFSLLFINPLWTEWRTSFSPLRPPLRNEIFSTLLWCLQKFFWHLWAHSKTITSKTILFTIQFMRLMSPKVRTFFSTHLHWRMYLLPLKSQQRFLPHAFTTLIIPDWQINFSSRPVGISLVLDLFRFISRTWDSIMHWSDSFRSWSLPPPVSLQVPNWQLCTMMSRSWRIIIWPSPSSFCKMKSVISSRTFRSESELYHITRSGDLFSSYCPSVVINE